VGRVRIENKGEYPKVSRRILVEKSPLATEVPI
jgi:hypothetical protein